MSKAIKKNSTPPAKRYELSDAETAAGNAYFKAKEDFPPLPRLTVDADAKGVLHVGTDHENPQIGALLNLAALGVPNPAFHDGMINQLVNVTNPTSNDTGKLNFAIAAIAGIKPKDAVESMLAGQMTAIHLATMDQARRLAQRENSIEIRIEAERALNRLARTFASQMEALKKYRATGEQRMVVERVDVQAGGQAVVGTVNTGGGGENKNGG